MCELSFIVPIYNGRNSIIRCLESICSQDLLSSEYEVLVIDDCSTDDTRELVSDFENYHPQVRLICQKCNHRQGAARNQGLKEAKGEYISFVDGDDIVLDGIIPALKWAERTRVDMVHCSCYHEKAVGDVILKGIDMLEGRIMTGPDFCEKYYNQGVFWYPWGFLIRREWLVQLNHPFVEDRQHEDRDWVSYILTRASSVINSRQPMYKYVFNPSSTCRSLRYSAVFDHIASGIRHIRLAEELKKTCPNLSRTLNEFGVDEISKSLRLRYLTKFKWSDNMSLYSKKHMQPLLADLRQVYKSQHLPSAVWLVAFAKPITISILFVTTPIAFIGRKVMAVFRKCN